MIAFFVCFSDIVHNTDKHIRVVEQLLKCEQWGEPLPDVITAPAAPAIPPRSSRHTPSAAVASSPVVSRPAAVIHSPSQGDMYATVGVPSSTPTPPPAASSGAGVGDVPTRLEDAEWYWGDISR